MHLLLYAACDGSSMTLRGAEGLAHDVRHAWTDTPPRGRWRDAVREVSLPVQLKLLKDTGRYDCFDLKPIPYYKKPMDVWPVPQHLFWESDCAK